MPHQRDPSDAAALDEPTGDVTPDHVTQLLRRVIDPELGVNIVDLGLVQQVDVDERTVRVQMTLTTPACPLGGYMEDRIHALLEPVEPVDAVRVDIVREPRWKPDDMSDAARRQLGWR